jgi:hypothetical protein
MVMRSVTLLVVLVACDERVCRFDDFVDDYASAEVIDCGEVEASYVPDNARYAEARACVVSANAARLPFVVRWNLLGVEGVIRKAYAGRYVDGQFEPVWEVSAFNRGTSISGGELMPMTRRSCLLFDDLGDDCSSIYGGLCFECLAEAASDECAAAD